MENPLSWGKAEKVVARALALADVSRKEGRMGLSTARQVTNALRNEGLLRDEEDDG